MRYNRFTINKKVLMFLFFCFIFLACFQNIQFFSAGLGAVRPFHVFSIVFVIFMIICNRFILPNKIIFLYMVFAIIISLAHASKWGLETLFFKYVVGVYILTIFCSMGTTLTLDEWVKIFKSVATIVIIAVYINYILNINAIIYFLRNPWLGHPAIKTFLGGGVNLEAAWVAIFGFAFYKSKLKLPYLFLSLLLSTTYASRVGLIASVMCILWNFIPNIKSKKLLSFIITGLLFIGIMIILNNIGIFDIVIDRFTNIGSESGSLGRIDMWKYIFKTAYIYPLGCGLGNCIEAISLVSHISFGESNVHNVFLQNLLDLGWIGGCFYLMIVLGFIIKETKNLFKNPFVAMLFSYIMCSMLQFAGGETILFCILGIYLCLDKSAGKSVVRTNCDKEYKNKYVMRQAYRY